MMSGTVRTCSLHRRGIRLPRAVVGTWAVLATTGALAAGGLTVSGNKVPWTSELPSGWIGGHWRQMERIIANTDSNFLRTILKEMLLDAKELDVYFLHTDVTGRGTKTVSSIRANVLAERFPLANKTHRGQIWQGYAKQLEGDYGPGAITTVMQDLATTTGGHAAYEAVFRTDLASDGMIYYAIHLVELPEGRTHFFRLRADARHIDQRLADFRQLLRSLRYR